jgi:hypothetical protein
MEACTLGVGASPSGLFFVGTQAYRHIQAGAMRIIPRWRHLDDLPVDQFGLALYFVEILNRGACLVLMSALLL